MTLLWDRLFEHHDASHGLRYWEGAELRFTPWAELMDRARSVAAGLADHGVTAGTPVAGVLTNTPEAVTGLMAVWLAGGTFVSLPDMARAMSPQDYADQLRILVGHAGVELVVVDDPTGFLETTSLGPVIHRTWEWVAALTGRLPLHGSPPGPDDPAFVQYSSGSTGQPKGCVLTPRAIDAQIDIIVALTGGEQGHGAMASWIPLSHDMGLFGCLLYPCALDFDFVMSSPLRFTFAPRTWFGDMARFGATVTAGTNTALSVAVRAQRAAKLADGLHDLRACVIGAEPNDPEVFRRAIQVFAPSGLRPEALISAYGLAEATLAVSGTPLDQAPGSVLVDRYALEDLKVVPAEPGSPEVLELASCGPPCPGVEVRAGEPGELATLEMASPSLATGYVGDPKLTAERFRDGWLHTADLGFIENGEVVVVGRSDDILVLGGRNFYAPQLERVIGDAIGVSPNRIAVIDLPVRQRRGLIAIIEPRGPDVDHGRLARAAADAVRRGSGMDLQHCFFVTKGSLPRTPSGKMQRQRCRNLIRDGRLDVVADIGLGPDSTGGQA